MVERDSRAGSRSYVEMIVSTVAERRGVRETDLPPLYSQIDPESLVRLVEQGDSSVRVTFTYCEYTVEVCGDGTVVVGDEPVTDGGRARERPRLKSRSVQS